MLRTARRATARGTISAYQVLSLSGLLGGAGMFVLYHMVNPLTMWLTFATFVGYAVIYTVILKPRTQNIVIGGLSGAMPPALGWAAVADSVPAEAWVLVLIIFIWTPPHFWALALYRNHDYAKAGLPMLPVTHGQQFTRLHILLYSVALLATTLLPHIILMSGVSHLTAALVLGGMFLSMHGACIANTATNWRAACSVSRSCTWRCCSARCWWITGSACCADRCRRLSMSVFSATRRLALRLGAAAAFAAALAACGESAPQFKGSDISGTRLGQGMELVDYNGKTRKLSDFGQGGGGVLRLHAVSRRLPDLAGRAGRGHEEAGRGCRPRAGAADHGGSRARHARYSQTIRDRVRPALPGLTGTPDQVKKAAASFKAYYAKAPTKDGGYSMDHTAAFYLLDGKGESRVLANNNIGVDALVHDIQALLRADQVLRRAGAAIRSPPRGGPRHSRSLQGGCPGSAAPRGRARRVHGGKRGMT